MLPVYNQPFQLQWHACVVTLVFSKYMFIESQLNRNNFELKSNFSCSVKAWIVNSIYSANDLINFITIWRDSIQYLFS